MQVSQFADFGGVDSRSNPLSMPKNRSLRCNNWVPQRDGHLELRWGYTTVPLGSVNPTGIGSITGYTLFDGTAYVVYPQQLTLRRMAMADYSVSILGVRGLPISAFHRWSWAFANNFMYGFNSTDAKVMSADGILRDNGLRALTADEAAAVIVAIGAPDPQGIISSSSLGSGGTGYAVNDTGIVDGTGVGATYKVLTVGAGGVVLTWGLTGSGTKGYIIEADTPTSTGGVQPGIGTGLTINILAVTDGGVPASTVGGLQPGYQFWASIWNHVTGHVGNRTAIGGRVAPTVASDINISGLPDFSLVDTEWVLLIGRTIDGGEVPYAVIDDSANWIYVANGTTAATITQFQIDMTSPLPYRNVPPQLFQQVATVTDRQFAALPADAHIFYTESAADTEASGEFQFVGDAQQSWPLDNFVTFPTGQAVTCLAASGQQACVFARNKMALLNDAAGVMTWQGEWDVGAAGWDAFVVTPYGPFWVTGKYELATMGASGPTPISDEYERALFQNASQQYILYTQVAYQRDPTRNIDRLIIRCVDENQVPFEIIHDFGIRDFASILGTRSPQGQGYGRQWGGPLAIDYNIGTVIDSDGFNVVFAAGNNGWIYRLDDGPGDGMNDFTADYLMLQNAGPNRPGMEGIDWHGDSRVQWYVGQKLSLGLTNLGPGTPADINASFEQFPGSDVDGVGTDSQYRVSLSNQELKFAFIRAMLPSQSNQTQDPHFEAGGRYWSYGAGAGLILDPTRPPYPILEIIAPAGPNVYATETNEDGTPRLIPVVEGQRVVVACNLAVDAGTFGDQAACLHCFAADGTFVDTIFGADPTAAGQLVLGQWGTLWGFGAIPAGVATVQLFVYATGGSSARFDNIWLTFLDGAAYTQELNNPPHCPLETYGRLYMINPDMVPEIGHE